MLSLQKLLLPRSRTALVFHRDQVLCSCGTALVDLEEAENHLTKCHEPSDPGSSLEESLQLLLENLKEAADASHKDSGKNALEIHLREIEVPENSVYVMLPEDEIGAGTGADFTCPHCVFRVQDPSSQAVTFPDFSALSTHFLRHHPDEWTAKSHPRLLQSKEAAAKFDPRRWNHCYFCPIPSCSHHLLSGNGRVRPFSERKLLRQHYMKVHALKKNSCKKCSQASFANKSLLARHEKICGLKFECLTCQASYSSYESLQTHARRKGHKIKSSEVKKGSASTPVMPLQIFTGSSELSPRLWHRSSPMHLNAAIALSELGNCSRSESGPSNLISAVVGQVSRGALIDVGVQTDLQSSRKRSAETQTRKGRKMAARTYKKKAEAFTGASSHIFSSDGRSSAAPKMCEMSAATQTDLPSSVLENVLSSLSSSETQTNNMVGPFVGSTPTNNPSFDDNSIGHDDDPVDRHTQFDIEDVLCSNYTQTGYMTSTILPLDVVPALVSIETQTIDCMFVENDEQLSKSHNHTQTH